MRGDGPVSLTYVGGLVVSGPESRKVIAFDIHYCDDATGRPLPGVWTPSVDGEAKAWMDARSGAPFGSRGNQIAFFPEPRVDNIGRLL